MSINHSITTGDWVRATAKNGAVIEGQAVHNLGMSGYPVLEIALHDDSGKRVDVRINVNFWDVYVIRPNLLQKAAECWEWQGRIDRNGYGKAYDPSRPAGQRVDWAHRVSYRAHRGEIPAGIELDHECENTRCINPSHLAPVTRAEHARRTVERAGGHAGQIEAARLRMRGLTYSEIAAAAGLGSRSAAKSRVLAAITSGLVGPDDIPRATYLSSEDKDDMVFLHSAGIPQTEIAAWYGVDSSAVSRVISKAREAT